MLRKKTAMLLEIIVLVISLSFSAWAEIAPGDIISYSVNDNDVTVYVANPEGKRSYELDCQIGTKRPQSIESKLVNEDTAPIKTIILMDNSLSVRSQYRDKIRDILVNLVENHADNEQYTVACFSDRLEYLISDSSDYQAVKEQIENVAYKDQETYLTDVLYELLANLKTDDGSLYRIVVVSDGVDNKSIGYTKEELNEKLKEKPVPLFMIGCSSGNNGEQLKNMFALSRNSKGEAFLIDDLEDFTEVIRSIKETDYTVKAVITPEKEDLDGSSKGILITFSTDGGTAQSSVNVDMPFAMIDAQQTEDIPSGAGVNEGVSPSESAVSTVEESSADGAGAAIPETSAAEAQPDKTVKLGKLEIKKDIFILIIAVAAVLLLVAGIIVLIVVLNKKKKRNAQAESDDYDVLTELISDDDCPTELISDDEATMLVEPTLVLRDERDSYTEYSAELSGTIVIGRRQDCNIVIPEKTVSRLQCEVEMSGGSVWIRNLSDHGTIVDGERAAGMQELRSGSRITIGNMTFTVEIR